MQFIFTHAAEKQFFQLPLPVQAAIKKKLLLVKQGGTGALRRLVHFEPFTHRLRIGEYRLLLRQCPEGFEVLKLGHRSTIYL
ncbi:MAG: hypothetical protein DLD55_06440 [candidate division SR1 bacterium]|nr:MAG: hypothetical protein DLD55_06440 [candidate division SR1 bacterium]